MGRNSLCHGRRSDSMDQLLPWNALTHCIRKLGIHANSDTDMVVTDAKSSPTNRNCITRLVRRLLALPTNITHSPASPPPFQPHNPSTPSPTPSTPFPRPPILPKTPTPRRSALDPRHLLAAPVKRRLNNGLDPLDPPNNLLPTLRPPTLPLLLRSRNLASRTRNFFPRNSRLH